jgi:WD40 repeat protein
LILTGKEEQALMECISNQGGKANQLTIEVPKRYEYMTKALSKLENKDLSIKTNQSLLIQRGLDATDSYLSCSKGLKGFNKVGDFSNHTGAVYCCSISPDSKLVASAGEDRVVRLWSLPDCIPIRELHGHDSKVYSVAFSPDNCTLLTGGWDRTLRLWDISSGKCLMILREHQRGVNEISISSDGLYAAATCTNDGIYIWDLVSGKLINKINGHSSAVISAKYLKGNNQIVSICDDQTLNLWDCDTRMEISSIDLKPVVPYCLLVADDYLYVGFGGINSGLLQTELNTKEKREFTYEGSDPIRTLSISRDQKQLVSGGEDKHLRLWNVVENVNVFEKISLPGWIWSTSFSYDGKFIIAGLESGTVPVFQWN